MIHFQWFWGISLAIFLISSLAVAEPPEWSYSGATGVKQWGKLAKEYQLCDSGKNQSPIDIGYTYHSSLSPLRFNYHSLPDEIENTGNTIRVHIQPGSYLIADHNKFELKEYHFHVPAQHKINGSLYPMEIDMVHENSAGEIAIVSILFSIGRENKRIDKLWDRIPQNKGEKIKLEGALRQIVNSSAQNIAYYQYNGSLETPPCTEGVRRYVIKRNAYLSNAQLDYYKSVMTEKNSRPPQPLHARAVMD